MHSVIYYPLEVMAERIMNRIGPVRESKKPQSSGGSRVELVVSQLPPVGQRLSAHPMIVYLAAKRLVLPNSQRDR